MLLIAHNTFIYSPTRLQQSAILLDEKTKVLNQTANQLDRNFDNWFILLYSAIFIGLVVLVVMFLHFFVPSWDEIKQRRQRTL